MRSRIKATWPTALLIGVAGCNYALDDYRVDDASPGPDALTAPDANAPGDDSRVEGDARDAGATPEDTFADPKDTGIEPADTGTARDAASCVCVDCPGKSGKCKAYDPPGCGPSNGPC